MSDNWDRSEEQRIQSLHRVVQRALIMSATVCRAFIESGAGQCEAESLYNRILDWLMDNI
jgi:hypothetical protein